MSKKKTDSLKPTNIHAGHRQRMKQKAETLGLGCFSEHEVLELMLTYVIPQKNTNPTAHALLNEFGSLFNVCNAGIYELESVPGVGKECARYLSFLHQFSEMLEKGKKVKVDTLGSTNGCVNYFHSNYRVTDTEAGYIICLNSRNKIIKTLVFGGASELKVMFDFREVLKQLIALKTYAIVIMHTHPNGDVKPSEQDLITTFQILKQCMMANIQVCNHLIFNEFGHYAMEKELSMFVKFLNKNYADMMAGDSQTLKQVLQEEK